MKKVFKIIGFGFLAFICLGIAVSMFGGGDTETTTEPKGTTIEKKEPKKEAADPVNQENFDKIVQGDSLTGEGGMTIEEVVAILGEADSEMESQAGDMVMKNLSWTGKKFQTISVSFTNGKVSYKGFMK